MFVHFIVHNLVIRSDLWGENSIFQQLSEQEVIYELNKSSYKWEISYIKKKLVRRVSSSPSS